MVPNPGIFRLNLGSLRQGQGIKLYVPSNWAVLFQESDRREETRPHEDAEPDNEDYEFIAYETSRETFLWRLSLVGASDSAMTLAFDTWIAQERETWKEYAGKWKDESREHAKRPNRANIQMWPRSVPFISLSSTKN